MGEHREINIPLGMTRKTELAIQLFHRCSNAVPAKCVGVPIDARNRATPLQFSATQNLQSCSKIRFTTGTVAIGSEQNPLGSI